MNSKGVMPNAEIPQQTSLEKQERVSKFYFRSPLGNNYLRRYIPSVPLTLKKLKIDTILFNIDVTVMTEECALKTLVHL